MQKLVVIEMNWNSDKQAEIKLIDSIPQEENSPAVCLVFDNLIKYVAQQWLMENMDDAATLSDLSQLPTRLQVC